MGSLVSTARPCHTSQSSFNRPPHLRSHSSREPVGFTPMPPTCFERKQIPHQHITKHKQEINPNQAAAHQHQHRTAPKTNEHAPNNATKHVQVNSTPTQKTSPESSHNTTLEIDKLATEPPTPTDTVSTPYQTDKAVHHNPLQKKQLELLLLAIGATIPLYTFENDKCSHNGLRSSGTPRATRREGENTVHISACP